MLLMSYLCDEKQTDCECLEIIVVTNYNDPRLMAESCRDTDKPSQTKTNTGGILNGQKYFV